MPCLMQVNGTDRESPPGWAGKAFGMPRAAALAPGPDARRASKARALF